MHIVFDPASPIEGEATFEEFVKLDIRIGTILSASPLRKARKPAYVLEIDFGSGIGVLKSSAQITQKYSAEGLINRQVLAVVNFPPRQVGSVRSDVLVLGCADENGQITLVVPDQALPNGARLS